MFTKHLCKILRIIARTYHFGFNLVGKDTCEFNFPDGILNVLVLLNSNL